MKPWIKDLYIALLIEKHNILDLSYWDCGSSTFWQKYSNSGYKKSVQKFIDSLQE